MWSRMGTVCSYRPPTGIRNPVTKVWASPRPSWGTDGWPGIVLVWPRCLNTHFTHQLNISFLDSSSSSRLYKSQSRCHGLSTKTCGTYRLNAHNVHLRATPRTIGQQCVATKSPRLCGQRFPLPDIKSSSNPNMSAPSQCAQGVQWHCYLPRSTPIKLGSLVVGAETKFCNTFTHPCRPL